MVDSRTEFLHSFSTARMANKTSGRAIRFSLSLASNIDQPTELTEDLSVQLTRCGLRASDARPSDHHLKTLTSGRSLFFYRLKC